MYYAEISSNFSFMTIVDNNTIIMNFLYRSAVSIKPLFFSLVDNTGILLLMLSTVTSGFHRVPVRKGSRYSLLDIKSS